MDYEDYRRLKIRLQGPLFASREYLSIVAPRLAMCDEGSKLIEQAGKKLLEAQQSVSLLIQYVERMHGFEE